MTLKAELKQALAQTSPFSQGEHTVALCAGQQELRCDLVALDTLACAFTRLVLRDLALAQLSTDGLRQTAQKLADRLTYLLEPISPIETDAQGCVVQLRSHPPQQEVDRTSYYELLVSRAGEISLCRYTRAQGQPRQVMPAEVTREVLYRLAADFAAAAS